MESQSIKCKNGNNITHNNIKYTCIHLQIYKSDVDRFSPGKCVHSCQMKFTWTENDMCEITPLNCMMKLDGATEEYNFLTIESPSACTS